MWAHQNQIEFSSYWTLTNRGSISQVLCAGESQNGFLTKIYFPHCFCWIYLTQTVLWCWKKKCLWLLSNWIELEGEKTCSQAKLCCGGNYFTRRLKERTKPNITNLLEEMKSCLKSNWQNQIKLHWPPINFVSTSSSPVKTHNGKFYWNVLLFLQSVYLNINYPFLDLKTCHSLKKCTSPFNSRVLN